MHRPRPSPSRSTKNRLIAADLSSQSSADELLSAGQLSERKRIGCRDEAPNSGRAGRRNGRAGERAKGERAKARVRP